MIYWKYVNLSKRKIFTKGGRKRCDLDGDFELEGGEASYNIEIGKKDFDKDSFFSNNVKTGIENRP